MSKTLGRYELLIRLAAGGAANVFLVRDTLAPPPGRLLALKILLPTLAANEEFLRMFFTEAQIAAKLRHPHVVAIAGFGQVEGIHCLAMEYVFGASLAQVLRASARARKPLTVGVLLQITAAVCDALQYAHDLEDEAGHPMGLVHRDVTPQNILIGFNGISKLTDFGIAKATNRGWETQAGIVKGKFSYMSPEQALGKKVDRRSDIFCTGIVLWEALTGRELFKGSTPLEVLSNIKDQKIDPPSKVVQGLTPIVDPIVMKALRRSPKNRYQSAAEMKNDIEDLIRRAGVRIDDQTISKEFAAIYGDEIVERAFALRAAMAGKADLEQLAKVLGGAVLSPKHLPVFTGGETHDDPLGLFVDLTPPSPSIPMTASVLPARADELFAEAKAKPASAGLVEPLINPQQDLDDISRLEPEPEPNPDPDIRISSSAVVPAARLVSGWDDSTAMSMPTDELLSMLSEEDLTIGYIPPEFAERFGKALRPAFDDSMADEPTDGAIKALKNLAVDVDGDAPWPDVPGSDFRVYKKLDRDTERSVRPDLASDDPRLSLEKAQRGGRPAPRAPSLDMEGASTPRPAVSAGDARRSRPLPKAPPPPPEASGLLLRGDSRADGSTQSDDIGERTSPDLLASVEADQSSMPGVSVLEDLSSEEISGFGQHPLATGAPSSRVSPIEVVEAPESVARVDSAAPQQTVIETGGVHLSVPALVALCAALLGIGFFAGLLFARFS